MTLAFIALTFFVVSLFAIVGWYATYQKLKIVKQSRQDILKQQANSIDLEMATTHQMINELSERPNYRFIMLVPHTQGNVPNVEIHSSNVSIFGALEILKVTAEGVEDTIRKNGPDDDLDFDF